jgi:hypothetical protein
MRRLGSHNHVVLLAASCITVACGRPVRHSPTEVTPVHATAMSAAADRPTGFPAECAPGEVEVMLLGTYHFEGSARDAVSGPSQDMLGSTRQAELEELVTRLAAWSPEQVAVEWPAEQADSTTARYARYLAAHGATTSSNEVVQVGFRLARRLGHPTVYPIDHMLPLSSDSIAPLLARRPALQARQDSVNAALRAESVRARAAPPVPITSRLHAMNTDSALHAGNSGAMFAWLPVGEGNNRGGPELLARWYERNLYMAHNLTRVRRPGVRRMLLLVGAGHVPPLRTILDESPEYCPVTPLPYLR